jgi:hypothetical protein
MNSFFLVSFLIFLTTPLLAAVPSAIKFYKSPSSPFASGEMDIKFLEKSQLSELPEFSYFVNSGKKSIWVKGTNLARDVQLGNFVFSNLKNRKYKVIQVQGSLLWGMPIGEGSNLPEWLSLEDVNPVLDDLGIAMTLLPTKLRESASWQSLSILTLPEHSRLEILQFKEKWAQVKFESVGSMIGWVDLSSLVLKFDFASHVMTSDKKWIPVMYRQGENMMSPNHGPIPLSRITAIMTRPNLGIAIKADDTQGLMLRQNLPLVSARNQVWNLSRLKGHGEVYWQAPLLKREDDILTTDQIMKREITSVSFHPKNQKMGILSSQGIYLTLDGEIWRKIPNFKNRSYPVLIDTESVIYVGGERSLDQGKSFFPCLKWESLAHLVEAKQRAVPKDLRITSIAQLKPGIMKYEIQTDLGKMRWSAKIANRAEHEYLTDWKFLGF